MNKLVTSDDSSPAGLPDECFWCKRKLREEHAAECVKRKKSVKVLVKFNIEVDVPEFWDQRRTEDYFNEDMSDVVFHFINGYIPEYCDKTEDSDGYLPEDIITVEVLEE